jgi:hypothetical protein
MLSIGIILNIQAKHAIMNGSLASKKSKWIRILWMLFFLGFLGYIAVFLILDKAISVEISQLYSYYPNILFGAILTYGIYNGLLYWQSIHIDNKNTKEA